MGVLSTLHSEIFRPFVALIIPGGFVVLPYALVLGKLYPEMIAFLKASSSLGLLCCLMVVVGAGLVLENLGSLIESKVYDPMLDREKRDHLKNWHTYLGLTLDPEPVGNQYLRTIIIRMKFELSIGVAIPFFGLGIYWLRCIGVVLISLRLYYVTVGLSVLLLYFLWEGYNSARLLSRIRKDIIEGQKSRNQALQHVADQ